MFKFKKNKKKIIKSKISPIKKIPFISVFLFLLKSQAVTNNKFSLKQSLKSIYIFKKSVYIFLSLLYCLSRIDIYNGRVYKSLSVQNTQKYLGYRFGEFVFTRRFGKGELIHLNKKKLSILKKKIKK